MSKTPNLGQGVQQTALQQTRRDFLTTSASGLGGVALTSLLAQDGLITQGAANPMAPRLPHYTPKAESCIFIFMAGAPSHIDLFDSKPALIKQHGKSLPKEILDKARFAFIKPDTAVLQGSKRVFKPYGQSGMEFSDYVPHLGGVSDDILMVKSMYSEEFNHHPGQLLMQCGASRFGLPTAGAWLTYGLGSGSKNLPGYVVLSAGRGSSGGTTLWQSGYLPSTYEGVLFRTQGEPVLNLENPDGLPPKLQRHGLDTLREINQGRYEKIRDPEIASRIASYELASRMQTAAPELTDLSKENTRTLEAYGVNRPEPKEIGGRGKQGNTYQDFARNCLMARRLVERGVRCVNIVYASWDHHSNLDPELKYNAGAVDQPIAALISDLKQRGLLDSTMVVWGSEFGRTPLGENRGGSKMNTGRDHHPFCFTTLMAGGGLKGGYTYGKTDEIGWNIVENPVHPNDLHATMLHCFGLDHEQLTYRHQGLDMRLTGVAGNVIKDWLA